MTEGQFAATLWNEKKFLRLSELLFIVRGKAHKLIEAFSDICAHLSLNSVVLVP